MKFSKENFLVWIIGIEIFYLGWWTKVYTITGLLSNTWLISILAFFVYVAVDHMVKNDYIRVSIKLVCSTLIGAFLVFMLIMCILGGTPLRAIACTTFGLNYKEGTAKKEKKYATPTHNYKLESANIKYKAAARHKAVADAQMSNPLNPSRRDAAIRSAIAQREMNEAMSDMISAVSESKK